VLVCHCLRVFDGVIRECVRGGARSPEDVAERCGAGSQCGGCRESIETIVERESSGPDVRLPLAAAPSRVAA
jgi:bacterioferritin-associated ferredoxin